MPERYNAPSMHPTDPTFGTLWWLHDKVIEEHWRRGHFEARQNNGHPLLVTAEHFAGRHAMIPCFFGRSEPHSKSFIAFLTPHNPKRTYFFDALKPIGGWFFHLRGPAYPNRWRPSLSATQKERLRAWLQNREDQ